MLLSSDKQDLKRMRTRKGKKETSAFLRKRNHFGVKEVTYGNRGFNAHYTISAETPITFCGYLLDRSYSSVNSKRICRVCNNIKKMSES